MIVGRVKEIWRYPVKSMAGERLPRSVIDRGGLPGDRSWAVRDERRGGIRGAKKIPDLMRCGAHFEESPTREKPGIPEIRLPDGSRLRADAPDAAARVSAAVGIDVTLWPLLPAEARDHYRRGAPDHADMETELRAMFGRTRDEPLPNFAAFPPELFEFESPPGTYFDAFPLLVLTTASLARLARVAPGSRIDVRRFRPNLVIDTEPALEGYVETAWEGRELRVGQLSLECTIACPRCVMITHGFDDLPKDAAIMRAVVRDANQSIGIYARPLGEANVALGDPVELVGS
jgi:MOSC domain-containing protein